MKQKLMALIGTIAAAAIVSVGLATTSGAAQTQATATPTAAAEATSSAEETGTPTAEATPVPTATATPIGSSEDTADTTQTAGTVTVDGVGQATAAPDSAVVELGVQSQAITASVALSQTSAQVQSLIDALTAAGIAADDIQTLSVNLFPIYDQSQTPTSEQNLAGFNATNIVRVRVRQLDQLGDLLDASVDAGANVVQSIRFELSDSDAALSQAREAAVSNARAKAEQLASLAGRELGDIRVIVESSTGAPVAFRDAMGGAAAVPIEPGTQSVQALVQITWELR